MCEYFIIFLLHIFDYIYKQNLVKYSFVVVLFYSAPFTPVIGEFVVYDSIHSFFHFSGGGGELECPSQAQNFAPFFIFGWV